MRTKTSHEITIHPDPLYPHRVRLCIDGQETALTASDLQQLARLFEAEASEMTRAQMAAPKADRPAPARLAAPQRERTQSRARTEAPPPRALPVLYRPPGSQKLPDVKGWTNRFEIRSESSDRLYVISQHADKRHWGCSCPGWRTHRRCKHLDALRLPAHEQPYEAVLK